MSDLKTQPTSNTADSYLQSIEDKDRKNDCTEIARLMSTVTESDGVMWGDSIVGYGKYHYKYDSGREGDWFLCGFSNRKQSISIYISAGFDKFDDLMKKLGNFKTGRSCLYIKRLSDIDTDTLKELIQQSVLYMQEKYPDQ